MSGIVKTLLDWIKVKSLGPDVSNQKTSLLLYFKNLERLGISIINRLGFEFISFECERTGCLSRSYNWVLCGYTTPCCHTSPCLLAMGAATSYCTKHPGAIYPVSEGNSTHFSPNFQEVRIALVLRARTPR